MIKKLIFNATNWARQLFPLHKNEIGVHFQIISFSGGE